MKLTALHFRKATPLCLFILLLSACGGSGSDTPTGPRVSILYAVAQDGEAQDKAALNNALDTVQAWYKSELNGKTFVGNVQSCSLPNVADYYAVDSRSKVLEDVASCESVKLDDSNTRWLIYADVTHECRTPGALELSDETVNVFSRLELDGLTGRGYADDCGNVYERSPQYYEGQMAHALGLSLGLRYPAGCFEDKSNCDEDSLMWTGYTQFPDTYLSENDKTELFKTPFIR